MIYRTYMLDRDGKIFCGEDTEASDSDAAIAAGQIISCLRTFLSQFPAYC
jgi:hypothetical protein